MRDSGCAARGLAAGVVWPDGNATIAGRATNVRATTQRERFIRNLAGTRDTRGERTPTNYCPRRPAVNPAPHSRTCYKTRIMRIAAAVALVLVCGPLAEVTPLAQEGRRPPALRLDPVPAIVEAFKTHEMVALSEGPHGNT